MTTWIVFTNHRILRVLAMTAESAEKAAPLAHGLGERVVRTEAAR